MMLDTHAPCVCYWLFDEACVDPATDGYVGISRQMPVRLQQHQKRFPNVQSKVLFAGSRIECLDFESKMRPNLNVGWNTARGGEGGITHLGLKRSNQSRSRMSVSAKQRGVAHLIGPEVRARAAASNTGQKRSAETRQKISERRKQHSGPNKGKTLSLENRQKISEGRLRFFAARNVIEQKCQHCGDVFVAPLRKYCSDSCKTMTCRDRKKEKSDSGI